MHGLRLQGKTAAELVHDSLAPVPNANNESDIAQLNAIRAGLATIAANSTGYSLAQVSRVGATAWHR